MVCTLLAISDVFSTYRMNVYFTYVQCICVWHAQQCLSIPSNYKKITFFLLFLCSTNTLHIPSCVAEVLLYVFFNSMCLLWLAAHLLPLETILNMCSGIMLPLLPVSILYGTIILFWSAVFLTWHLVWNSFYQTEVNLCSPMQCLCLHCLVLSLAPPGPPTPTYFLEVANLAALHAHLSICRALSWWVCAATVPAYLFWWHAWLCWPSGAVFAEILRYSNFIKTPLSLLWCSSLLTELFAPLPSLPMTKYFHCGVSLLFVVLNCEIISPSTPLSFSPWINCSFNCLSSSW